MSLVDNITRLLEQGRVLEAGRLADEHKITDCRNICQNLPEITNIADTIEHSISLISSLEARISSYDSELKGIKDVAFEIKEEEQATQVERKNIEDVCELVDNLLKNLRVPEHIPKTLLEANLDNEDSFETIQKTLDEFENIFLYKPDPILFEMKCVRDHWEHAYDIKSKFHERLTNLRTEFIDFVNNYNDQDGLYSLYLLTRLSQYLSNQNSPSSFLQQIYGEARIMVKRNFDSFMEQQINSIRELKAPKQSKCGVLCAVKSFEQFAGQVENLFDESDARRSEVDRWYPELVAELFRTIERIEHHRTPTEMVRLENFKYLHDVLSSIKVPCLKSKTKEAKVQYEAALSAYVTRYFGRPLEKVNAFFEGVQAKVSQGVKEEEISFQLAFSKQELRKVLQMVTLKEVRKGLEEMYRRIEKHAFEPRSNLIEVIWHAMQTEFLSQYKAIQGMIERCYPSSNLSLMFSIEDVLQVFSDIAQSH